MTMCAIKLIMIVAMLGADTYQERQAAYHQIANGEFCYQEVRDIYYKYNLRTNPEIKLKLREIMWLKYQAEFDILYTSHYSEGIDYKLMRDAFELDVRVNDNKEDEQ